MISDTESISSARATFHAEDNALVARFKNGDESAFTELFNRHIASLRRYAKSIVKSDADADEIAQDTLRNAYKYLRNFRGECTFKGWACEICRRLSINRLSSVGYRLRRMLPLDAPIDDTTLTIADTIAADIPSPYDEVAASEVVESVDCGMGKLSKRFYDILTLRAVHGYSHEQISQAHGIPIGTVKSRLSRARDMLKKKVRKEAFAGGGVK